MTPLPVDLLTAQDRSGGAYISDDCLYPGHSPPMFQHGSMDATQYLDTRLSL